MRRIVGGFQWVIIRLCLGRACTPWCKSSPEKVRRWYVYLPSNVYVRNPHLKWFRIISPLVTCIFEVHFSLLELFQLKFIRRSSPNNHSVGLIVRCDYRCVGIFSRSGSHSLSAFVDFLAACVTTLRVIIRQVLDSLTLLRVYLHFCCWILHSFSAWIQSFVYALLALKTQAALSVGLYG